MKHDWESYKEKVYELKGLLKNVNKGSNIDVDVLIPSDKDYSSEKGIPYVRIRYYINDHFQERKIELYEHYLKRNLKDLMNLIEHFIQEFEMEIDQSQYGGG